MRDSGPYGFSSGASQPPASVHVQVIMWSVHVRCAASSAEPGSGGVRGAVVGVVCNREASSCGRECSVRDSVVFCIVWATPLSVSLDVVASRGVCGGVASSVGAIAVDGCGEVGQLLIT